MLQALQHRRKCKTHLTAASKLAPESNLVESIELFREALQTYKEADKKFQDLDKNSDSVRKKFQEDLAQDIAGQKGTAAAKEIKSLI